MLISGYHAIESILIERPELILKLFLSRSEDKRGAKIKSLANSSQINFEILDSKKIDQTAGHSKHQGFLAEISNPGFLSEKDVIPRLKNLNTSRVLILDSIQDPKPNNQYP